MSQGHVIIKQFVEFARATAPTRHQKKFKQVLTIWFGKLNDKDRDALCIRLMKSQRRKRQSWREFSDELFDTFIKKDQEVNRGSLGSSP